jgi:hypothetical protein
MIPNSARVESMDTWTTQKVYTKELKGLGIQINPW